MLKKFPPLACVPCFRLYRRPQEHRTHDWWLSACQIWLLPSIGMTCSLFRFMYVLNEVHNFALEPHMQYASQVNYFHGSLTFALAGGHFDHTKWILHTFLYINFSAFLKISAQGHLRSGEVTLPQKVFRISP